MLEEYLFNVRDSVFVFLRRRLRPRRVAAKNFEDKVSSDSSYVRAMQVLVARARLILY